jgi:hypothetical protein
MSILCSGIYPNLSPLCFACAFLPFFISLSYRARAQAKARRKQMPRHRLNPGPAQTRPGSRAIRAQARHRALISAPASRRRLSHQQRGPAAQARRFPAGAASARSTAPTQIRRAISARLSAPARLRPYSARPRSAQAQLRPGSGAMRPGSGPIQPGQIRLRPGSARLRSSSGPATALFGPAPALCGPAQARSMASRMSSGRRSCAAAAAARGLPTSPAPSCARRAPIPVARVIYARQRADPGRARLGGAA